MLVIMFHLGRVNSVLIIVFHLGQVNSILIITRRGDGSVLRVVMSGGCVRSPVNSMLVITFQLRQVN